MQDSKNISSYKDVSISGNGGVPLPSSFDEISTISEIHSKDLAADRQERVIRNAPGECCIHQLFAEQAAQTPDSTAVEFEGTSLSYRALDARANQLAHLLRDYNVGPDVRVGIFMDRSLQFVISILGTLKAGGAYVPLDPSYPSGRLQMMLEEAEATVLLSQPHLTDRVRTPDNCAVLTLEEQENHLDQKPEGPLSSETTSENLAYVLFTSGSTGRPKGVAMPHGPLVNLIDWQCQRSILSNGDRTLQFSALSFDVSFQEIFSTWCSGGTLILVSEETRHDASALLRLIEEKSVQRLFLPFVALQHITEIAQAKDLYPSSLREVITAGEQLKTVPSLQAFFRRLPHCTLENQYGPTETHVVTAYRLPSNVENWATLPSIGRPIPSAEIHLLDENRNPVDEGETGEIYIGGNCLAREYLNRPEQTEKQFLQNPFNDAADARLYRTGDLARYQSDGTLEFLGRADHQVKVRGYRVELGEIEALLNEHETVREAVVTPDQGNVQGNHSLIAYVIPQPEYSVNESTLQIYLEERLPEYMVPSSYVALENFPLTPSGKVDRKALSQLDKAPVVTNREEVVAPRTELEQVLVDLWEEALDKRPIGIRDDFFSLGGHSIMAAEMLVELSQILNRELPLSLLADTPTIEALAKKLEQEDSDRDWSILVPIRPQGTSPPLFCIHGGGMNVLRFRSLAQQLDENQPVYGLQWVGLDGRQVTPRIEALATEYLESLRSVQPTGPYRLAGHCFGGLVAYEIAQRLQKQGETVDLLVMFDAPNMTSTAVKPPTQNDRFRDVLPDSLSNPEELLYWIRRNLALRTRLHGYSALLTGRTIPREHQQHARGILERSWLVRAVNAISLSLGRKVPALGRPNYAVHMMEKAVGAYRPKSYDGKILFIHSGTEVGGYPERTFTDGMLGWESLRSKEFEYHHVNADHNGILDHPDTAEFLQSNLDAVSETVSDDLH